MQIPNDFGATGFSAAPFSIILNEMDEIFRGLLCKIEERVELPSLTVIVGASSVDFSSHIVQMSLRERKSEKKVVSNPNRGT